MYKVLVFGGLPIASEVCRIISDNEYCELAGVVMAGEPKNNHDPFIGVPMLKDYALNKKIPIYSFSEINKLFDKEDFDIGICARFSKILKKSHIELFKYGVINFHGGLLPEFAGLYSANHVILKNKSTSGGTIHWVDEGIDTGQIIKSFKFKIDPLDTAHQVFQKTQSALLDGFKEILPKLINSNFEYIEQNNAIQSTPGYFDKNSLKGKKEVSLDKLLNGDANELNRIRAFDFPGHEPAYAVINGIKVYLTLSK